MSIAADQSILDLIRPPDGYRFGSGVWITHDLRTRALMDLVLPALAGVERPSGGYGGPRPRHCKAQIWWSWRRQTGCRTAGFLRRNW